MGKRGVIKGLANAHKNEHKIEPPERPTSVHDLPDDLLRRVLLHIGLPVNDLVRAAATCRRWRRAIVDPSFLAHFRSLNGASRVAGHYYVPEPPPPKETDPPRRHDRPAAKMPPVFMPAASPSASVVDSAVFSLDFLARKKRAVRSRRTEIIDSRGSLLLLNAGPWSFSTFYHTSWHQYAPDLIVCEPATRRFQRIPCPPDFRRLWFLGSFLVDGTGDNATVVDAMSSFRVLYVLYQYDTSGISHTARAFVFGPGSQGGWRLGWRTTEDDVRLLPLEKITLAGRAAGKVYWGIETGRALVLDESTLRFELVAFPDHILHPDKKTSFRVIGGSSEHDGTVRVVRVGGQELDVLSLMPGSSEWVVETTVQLRDAAAGLPGWDDKLLLQPARIVAAGDTFVVLTPVEKTWLFSVDLDTMELESKHERNRHVGQAFPCSLPWPPVLQVCLDQATGVVGKRRQHRNCSSS